MDFHDLPVFIVFANSIESSSGVAIMGTENRRLAEERFNVCKSNARLLNILEVS